MPNDPEACLLRDLHEGRTSRNRDFERFSDGGSRRVLRGYRRVRSLLGELREPGVEAAVRSGPIPGAKSVEVVLRGLRYHRSAVLTPAEFALLEDELGTDAPWRGPGEGRVPPRK